MISQEEAELEALLEYVHRLRGIDFSAYKPTSLRRRISKRMQVVGVTTVSDYLDHAQASPNEVDQLLNTLFINVTHFFRDRDAWDVIRDTTVPSMITANRDGPIRVWSAGSATGEEAYSVAMLLWDALGPDGYRQRVKIYATDADEAVLVQARAATYPAKALEEVPDDMRGRHFEEHGGEFRVKADLRRGVIFGRHDLLSDAPISRLDLLICRNTLMYFNREAQSRILARFHFSLRDSGTLFLGKAEMLLTRRTMFLPLNSSARIFRKVSSMGFRDRLTLLAAAGQEDVTGDLSQHAQMRDLAFQSSPVPQLIIDSAGMLSLANMGARKLFSIGPDDLGRPFHDLGVSYRPLELRSLMEQATKTGQPIVVPAVERISADGGHVYLDVEVQPVMDEEGTHVATSVTFTDVTHFQALRAELEHSNHQLEAAYEELQSTNEELETTNEELQSTNEELETMNEELQSTNEEIRAVNDELRDRTAVVDRLNAYMQSVVDSVGVGMVVLDSDLLVEIWNVKAEEFWGIRKDEVRRQPFLNLDIGLPVDGVREHIRACLRGETPQATAVLDCHDRKGRQLKCRVTCVPLHATGGHVNGVILLMEEWPAQRPHASEASAQNV